MTSQETRVPFPLPPQQPASTTAPASGRVVIVTGMSGAGKTSALKIFEDLGYEAVDNLPLRLLGGLLQDPAQPTARPLAIGIDIRTRDFDVASLQARLRDLRQTDHLTVQLLFLDADDEILRNRFTETRRRHPAGEDLPVSDGITVERSLLRDLRSHADILIDTSLLSPQQFRDQITHLFTTTQSPGMSLFVLSFGFRNGLPRGADMVFDVRFLRNPHYDPSLRPLTGQNPLVSDYVMADPAFSGFFTHLTDLLAPLLPRYQQEGKSYLTIAVGCTGGQHRSVATAERLAHWLADRGLHVLVRHRDIPRPETPERTEGTT